MSGVKSYIKAGFLVFNKNDPPRIANRTDAIRLIDQMIEAEAMENYDVALEALKDAIERENL